MGGALGDSCDAFAELEHIGVWEHAAEEREMLEQ